jgi:hypothetical protein
MARYLLYRHQLTAFLPLTQSREFSRLAFFFSYVPDGYNRILSGPVDDRKRIRWDQSPAPGHFKSIQKDIMLEFYGKDSFLRDWTAGELSKEEFIVSITNMELKARLYDMVPPTETPQATVRRTTRAAACRASGARLVKIVSRNSPSTTHVHQQMVTAQGGQPSLPPRCRPPHDGPQQQHRCSGQGGVRQRLLR